MIRRFIALYAVKFLKGYTKQYCDNYCGIKLKRLARRIGEEV